MQNKNNNAGAYAVIAFLTFMAGMALILWLKKGVDLASERIEKTIHGVIK